MRKILSITILLLSVFLVDAQPTNLLKQANGLYATSKYAEAIAAYENIIKKGYESGALYFNLGNAYYKTGEANKAILNYERAKLFSPGDDDIQFNLELVNQFVVDKIEPLPRPFFVKWGQSVVNIFSSNGWATFSLITFILMLAFAAVYIFTLSSSFKKISFILGIVMLVFSFSTFGCARQKKATITKRNHAIVFASTVTVKASPDESGTNLFVIHEGLKIEIKEELGSWANVKLEDGNSGWVKRSVFEKI